MSAKQAVLGITNIASESSPFQIFQSSKMATYWINNDPTQQRVDRVLARQLRG